MTQPAHNLAALSASLAGLASASATSSNAAPAKDKATIYLGIGTLRDGADVNSDDFDPAKDLINLPQLTGLDNMNPDTRKAGTVEFATQQAERNEFLEDLKAQAMAKLAPGETAIIPLFVTVYRKKDDVVAAPTAAARPKQSFFG